MDSVKKHWIEISVGVAVSAFTAYALYRVSLTGGKAPVKVNDPFREVIDQRAS